MSERFPHIATPKDGRLVALLGPLADADGASDVDLHTTLGRVLAARALVRRELSTLEDTGTLDVLLTLLREEDAHALQAILTNYQRVASASRSYVDAENAKRADLSSDDASRPAHAPSSAPHTFRVHQPDPPAWNHHPLDEDLRTGADEAPTVENPTRNGEDGIATTSPHHNKA